MTTCFFIQSSTVDTTKYTIKDVVGSSGRLDVIVRCILAALLREDEFEKDVQVWTFLDNYGTFIFDPEKLNYSSFPKNELVLSDCFARLIQADDSTERDNPLHAVSRTGKGIVEVVRDFTDLGYEVFVLSEKGQDFFTSVEALRAKSNLLFNIGDQTGDIVNSGEILDLHLPSLSFGARSYLASSIIRLIKIFLFLEG